MKLFRTTDGVVCEKKGDYFLVDDSWDHLVNREDLIGFLERRLEEPGARTIPDLFASGSLLPPIESQEVWGAGVTYLMSREARKEEARDAGGGDFYHRVYDAKRPEIFFKTTAHRVKGPGQPVHIRRDSNWNVPEPELTALVSKHGKLVGFTVGNDMSSRDIEGENPLYLPQAKTFDGCCALGPGVLLTSDSLSRETGITLLTERNGKIIFTGQTTLAQMKRSIQELIGYLFRESTFPQGCYLLTGTGIIPPSDFTLREGDIVKIEIDSIGMLVNPVTIKKD